MRDKERINEFLAEFGRYWQKNQDLRFGQIVCNLQRYARNDLFYYEEGQLLDLLEKFEKESW